MKRRIYQLLATILITGLVLTPVAETGMTVYAEDGGMAQEELAQEEPTQAEPTQEEPTQEEPVQEEPVQEEPVQEEPTIAGGYIELPIDNAAPALGTSSYGVSLLTAESIPSSYHASLAELTSKYPATRNQNPYGTCWAHATIACMEFDLIQDGAASKSINYSELQMAYFTYYLAQEPLGGFDGASSRCTASSGFLDIGGNIYLAARRLEQWCGAANDSGELAYTNASTVKANLDVTGTGLSGTYAYNSNVAYLTDMYLINLDDNKDGRKDSTDAKRAIMEHGAIGISYYYTSQYANSYSATYNGVNYGGTYYDPVHTTSNHAITIVGWDDSIPAGVFATASSSSIPAGDGAWLCRNSWTTSTAMNEDSYFWMSYYDKSLAVTAYAFDATIGSEYDNNYQYDSAAYTGNLGGTYVANVFTTPNKSGVVAEELKAVSFSISQNTNVGYTIQVYTDVDTSGNNPTNGTLQTAATTTGRTSYAGYYTIPLENSVVLDPGTTYSVVVKLDIPTGQSTYGIDVEYGHHQSDWYIEVANIKPKQSFVYHSYNGAWADQYGYIQSYPSYVGYYGNYCIKAFTCDILEGAHYLATPQNLKATYVSDTMVKVTWNAVASAVGYELQSYNSSTGVWNTIASTTSCEYLLSTSLDKEYKYRVRAYALDGGDRYYSSYSSECTYSTNQSYTITYVLNGGQNAASNPSTYKKTSNTITLANPTRSGYSFGGWYTTSNFSGTKITTIPKGSSGNITLYAKWNCAHTSKTTINAQTATCTQGGYSGDTMCLSCYQIISYGSYIPPKGHQNTQVYNARTATCGTSGYTGNTYCWDCYTYIANGTVIPATGKHTWNSGTVIVAATTTSTGIIQYRCTTCGATKTETIARRSAPKVNVSYQTHVQSYGWQNYVSNGAMSGTSGEAKRLEGIRISVSGNSNVGIRYITHVESYGWLGNSYNGQMSGTTGEAKRLEAIMIELYGADAELYDVYYRVHAQSYGWLGWAKNGEAAGTAGYAKRLEGIQILVVEKNQPINQYMGGIVSNYSTPYISSTSARPRISTNAGVMYQTHVQSYGWQNYVNNGAVSGTSGEAKRLEGIRISLTEQPYDGSICYTTHVQSYGWQGDVNNPSTWKRDGEMAGTSGEAKRLEAICICLTGDMAEHYDVYYRVHCQSIGWMGWAKNGEMAGTAGYAYRLEAIQIQLVPKGGTPPSGSGSAFRQK